MNTERGEDVTYQWALRAIGAHLDRERGNFMSLVETPDGFALRYRRPGGASALSQFTVEELRAFEAEMRSQRGAIGPRDRAQSYQDWFRALGWELDQTHAYSVVCDDLDEGVLVTYLQLDPRQGQVVEKRLAVLGPVDKVSILQEAQARRGSSHLAS